MHFSRPIRIVTGLIFASVIAPLGLFVERAVGDLAETADQSPIGLDENGRDAAARRLVHERHELVRETGHGAADADAADIRAAANTGDPATLGHVALHHGAPAADLHKAFARTVLLRKIGLLVIGATIATLVYRRSEKPSRPAMTINGNHRGEAGELPQQVQESLHEIVRLDRTPGDIHDWQSSL